MRISRRRVGSTEAADGAELKTQETGDPQTRQALMDAARVIFSEKDYLTATVDDIVREAGCARGTFYLYFKNKQDIFERLVEQATDEMFGETYQGASGDVFARMEFRNRSFVSAFAKHVGILRNLYLVASFNPTVATVHFDQQAKAAARMLRLLKSSMKSADRDGVNLDVASWGLILMVEGFAQMWLAAKQFPGGETLSAEEVVSTLSSLLYRAIFLEGSSSRNSAAAAQGPRPSA